MNSLTDSKEDGLRFAENARYQSRLASSLRRRQEVMQGTVLVDMPFPDEPPLEQIHSDLLISDVEAAAEKLVGEIRATHPVHMCFSFNVGATPHTRKRPSGPTTAPKRRKSGMPPFHPIRQFGA
jgi:hypothetical protein